MSEPAVDRITVVQVFDPNAERKAESNPNMVSYGSTTSPDEEDAIAAELDIQDQLKDPPLPEADFNRQFLIYQDLAWKALGIHVSRSGFEVSGESYDELSGQIAMLDYYLKHGIDPEGAQLDYATERGGILAAIAGSPQAIEMTGYELAARRQMVDDLRDRLEGMSATELGIEVIRMVRAARAKLIIEGSAALSSVQDTLDLGEFALDTKLWVTCSQDERRSLGAAARRLNSLRDTFNR
jgi:hypothetical protein